MRPRKRFLVCALLAFLAAARGVVAETAQEYAVKASFISKFVGFVQWPDQGRPKDGGQEPFVVAVVGANPFREDLENAFRGVDLGGRPVRIKAVADAEDLTACNLLFVSASEKDQLAKILRWAEQNRALTVGDGEGFGERGVIINFYLRDDKVRFEINTRAAEKNGFQISSLLLKVARIVGDK